MTTVTKLYSELRSGDEFLALYDRRLVRVFVAAPIKRRDTQVEVAVHPCTRGYNQKKIVRLKFAAAMPIEVFRDRISRGDIDRWYEERIFRVIEEGDRPVSRDEIVARLVRLAEFSEHQPFQHRVHAVLQDMTKRKRLILKLDRCKKLYRRPLKVGAIVVEYELQRSERFGVLVRHQEMKGTGFYHPVIRWENGSESFSHEERLNPIDSSCFAHRQAARRIQSAQQPSEGAQSSKDDRVEIPIPILLRLQDDYVAASLEVAKLMGLVQPEIESWRNIQSQRQSQIRNAVSSFLLVHYYSYLQRHAS